MGFNSGFEVLIMSIKTRRLQQVC